MASARAVALAPGALIPRPGIFCGLSLRETAGAVATVRLWDNPAAAAGALVAAVALTANADRVISIAGDGIWFSGLFVEVVAGTVEGSVYVG